MTAGQVHAACVTPIWEQGPAAGSILEVEGASSARVDKGAGNQMGGYNAENRLKRLPGK